MIRLDEALAEYVAALLADASLTPAQRDRLAVLLRPAPHTPVPRSPRPVASARSASLRLSAGARATRTVTQPQDATHAEHGPLRRPAFSAIPRRPS